MSTDYGLGAAWSRVNAGFVMGVSPPVHGEYWRLFLQKKARRSTGDQRAQDASLSSRCATGSGRKSRAEVRTSGPEMILGFTQTGIELLVALHLDRVLPPASGQLSGWSATAAM